MKFKRGKKSGLKYFGIDDIRSYGPCYDPKRYLSKTFRGTALDILNNNKIPANDRLWVVLRSDITSERVMRLFAIWSFREIVRIGVHIDCRSVIAANVVEAYAIGKATKAELSDASSAAYAAFHTYSVFSYNAYAAYAIYVATAPSYHTRCCYAYFSAVYSSTAYSSAASTISNASLASRQADFKEKQIKKLAEMLVVEGKEIILRKSDIK